MARPPKDGFDYFPHEVTMHDDTAIMLAGDEHGDFCTVFAIYNLLLGRIYEKHGYYLLWGDAEALRLKRITGLPVPEVQGALDALVDAGVFDRHCLDAHHAVTSKGIQRRYLTLAGKRKASAIHPTLMLVGEPVENPARPVQPVENPGGGNSDGFVFDAETGVSGEETGVFVAEMPDTGATGGVFDAETGVSGEEMPQSKVKESKVNKNKEKKTKEDAGMQRGFKAFWLSYPKKVGRGSAEKCWARLNLTPALLSQILDAVEQQKASPQWRKEGGQFIPHPTTWLNQRRWEDEAYSGPAPPPSLAAYGRVDIVVGG